jgi:mRNA interferase RelE/StbE
MDYRVAVGNPRASGKAMHASLEDYWSYRVGDYRLICEIRDQTLVVLVVEIGHRSDVYR